MKTYTLKYYLSGETYQDKINLSNHTETLVEIVKNIMFDIGDPDTVFKLEDSEGNVLFTEEDF